MSVEVVLKNVAKTVGEGPHWDSSTNSLFFVDIMANSIHRWDPATGQDEVVQLDRTVGFVVPARKGGFIIGLGNTFSHLDWNTKKVTILHEVDKGKDVIVNDGKCDPRGRVWAGTLGPISAGDISKLEPIGSLYCLDIDGKLHRRLSNIRLSNGMAWNKQGTVMYFIDSLEQQVSAFDYDIETGEIANRKVVVDLRTGTMPETGMPDGMTVDADGFLWVACMLSGKVLQFDPQTGKTMRTVKCPSLRITSCCFGGTDLCELYMTSAKGRATEEELQTYPLSGSLFRVKDLGVRGIPASVYEG